MPLGPFPAFFQAVFITLLSGLNSVSPGPPGSPLVRLFSLFSHPPLLIQCFSPVSISRSANWQDDELPCREEGPDFLIVCRRVCIRWFA